MRWPWIKKKEFVPIQAGDPGEGTLDTYSPTWIFIKNHIEDQLKKKRLANDSPLLTVEQTAVIRGEIKALKKLATLPEILTSRENRLKNSSRQNTAGEDEL